VAAEAGLSQGVAVFYFKSKNGLLAETLRAQYETYAINWRMALEAAGDDPRVKLDALVEADFSPQVCSPDALSIWFAFWGEQNFTPQYAEISREFDADRAATIRDICATLLPDQPREETDAIAKWIDTLTDGFWQKIHLHPGRATRDEALASTRKLIAQLLGDLRKPS
jgi:TetR/AcrR family transcriptional repressor of bet genes